jgi:hypothetical protein
LIFQHCPEIFKRAAHRVKWHANREAYIILLKGCQVIYGRKQRADFFV